MNPILGRFAIALMTVAPICSASEGEPDPGFDIDGRTVLAFDQDPADPRDLANRVATWNDFVYVLGSVSRPDTIVSSITRLLEDGTKDLSFGAGGTVFIDTLDGFYDGYRIHALAIDASGKLVVGGDAELAGNTDMLVCRILPTGQFESSFGGQGSGCNTIAIDRIPGGHDSTTAVLLQPNGRIVLGGNASLGQSRHDMAIARFTANGVVDGSFVGTVGGTGYATVAFPSWQSATLARLAIDPEARLVLGGTVGQRDAIPCDEDFALARLTSAGKVDLSFGGEGKITRDFDLGPVIDGCHYWSDRLTGLWVLPDSSVLATGGALVSDIFFDRYLAMVKVDAFGAPAPGFSMGATPLCDSCSMTDIVDMAMAPDGRFVIAATTLVGSTADFALVRRMPDGTPDTLSAIVPFVHQGEDGHDRAEAMVLHGGRPVIVGSRQSIADPSNYDMAIARLTGDSIFEHDFEL
jgi:uncharacterized delta-60 repeat protein